MEAFIVEIRNGEEEKNILAFKSEWKAGYLESSYFQLLSNWPFQFSNSDCERTFFCFEENPN